MGSGRALAPWNVFATHARLIPRSQNFPAHRTLPPLPQPSAILTSISREASMLIARMQQMQQQGMTRDQIAEQLMVSRAWVDMVMDTDAFSVEQKGEDDETA